MRPIFYLFSPSYPPLPASISQSLERSALCTGPNPLPSFSSSTFPPPPSCFLSFSLNPSNAIFPLSFLSNWVNIALRLRVVSRRWMFRAASLLCLSGSALSTRGELGAEDWSTAEGGFLSHGKQDPMPLCYYLPNNWKIRAISVQGNEELVCAPFSICLTAQPGCFYVFKHLIYISIKPNSYNITILTPHFPYYHLHQFPKLPEIHLSVSVLIHFLHKSRPILLILRAFQH